MPSVEVVVLSSHLAQVLEPSGNDVLERIDSRETLGPANARAARSALSRTVDAIRALGKRVVLVAPLPHAPFHAARCHDRAKSRLLMIGGTIDCAIEQRFDERSGAGVLALLKEIEGRGSVPVLWLDGHLCHDGRCHTGGAGMLLYRDDKHLSHTGSHWIAAKALLADRIDWVAR